MSVTSFIIVDLGNPFFKGDHCDRIRNALVHAQGDLNEERDLLMVCVEALRPSWRAWPDDYNCSARTTSHFDMADVAQNERIIRETRNRITDCLMVILEARLLPPNEFAQLFRWYHRLDGKIRFGFVGGFAGEAG